MTTTSESGIIKLARSREPHGDFPEIDPEILVDDQKRSHLLGNDSNVDHDKNGKSKFFRPISFKKKYSIISAILILTILFSLAYADRIFRSDTIAHGISVDHIDVGGLKVEAAKNKLESAEQKALDTPITFSLNKKNISISSQDLDLKYDTDATVKKAKDIDRSFNPLSVLPGFLIRYTTGKTIEPESTYNKDKYDAVVDNIVDSLSVGRANAGITIKGTKVEVIPPKSGKGVSESQARQALDDSIAQYGRKNTELELENVQSQITLSEAQSTAKTLETMFESESTLSTPAGNTIKITPETLALAITITPVKKVLQIGIDEEKIRAALTDQLNAVEVAPKDASFSVNGSSISVIPSTPGSQIDFQSALAQWEKGLHEFQVSIRQIEPVRNTQWAQKLNITEAVGSFSTKFTAGQARVKNIAHAAEQVNNTILEPGEIFSLNQALGERSAENGYVKAPVYSDADGFFEDYGGGASQFSTTLFNAAFIAGYKDVTHTPHTIYISRYPMGREATLNWGSIDMSFKNDSNSGILIRTGLGSTSVSVTLYGNKEGRTVKLEGPVELGRTEIATQYTDDPNLEVGVEKEVQKGYPGIVVENYRTVDRPNNPGRKERYRWTYNMIPRKVIRGTKPVGP